MRTRYRISVGGVQMDTLDNKLCILNISYAPPETELKTHTNANLNGYDVGEEKIIRRRVTVIFELHEYSITARNALCQKVNNWAAVGGTLITNDREGQRLYNTKCEQFVDVSARDWTEPLTLVFATTYDPHWQSNTAITKTLTGKNVSGSMDLDGNIGKALVSVTATAQETVKSFKATVGSYVLELTGLSVANGQTIVIDYVRRRYLRIRANGSNVQAKMKATSSDCLLAECGKANTIGIVADGKVSAVFSARGCWR